MKALNIKSNTNLTIRDSISLKKYLNEVAAIGLLTVDEEVELFRRYRAGDLSARTVLIRSNLRFVLSCAKFYVNMGVSYEDLVSEGNLGLTKAVEKFDETRGFKFISYAVFWVQQAILQSIYNNSKTLRIPTIKYTILNKINTYKANYVQLNGIEPSLENMEEELLIPIKEIVKVTESFNPLAYLDEINPNTENSLYEILPAEKIIEDTDDLDNLKSIIPVLLDKCVKKDEREVLVHLYGLESNPELTIGQVQKKLKLSRSQVTNKRATAIKRIRFYIERNKNFKKLLF